MTGRKSSQEMALLLCVGQALVVNSQLLAVGKKKKWRNNRYPRILELVVCPVGDKNRNTRTDGKRAVRSITRYTLNAGVSAGKTSVCCALHR